ncbi:MAG: hypothetical protein JSV52_01790 [Candidatus Zixiibacteriota bacterium]|nr:MAG: hypothetical protein JSV52_01790 [candidate division Zixibacteria bacterium]
MRPLRYIVGALMLSVISFSFASAALLNNPDKLSMELESVALRTVLNMIAQQYSLNLVVADNVEGEVSLRLENVDIETALEAILYPNGYNFYMKEDVIIVKPIEFEAVGELVAEVVTLKYIEPITAKNALEVIKSSKGKIIVLSKTAEQEGAAGDDAYAANRIAISDYPSVVSRMMALIAEMDKPERQISIEVKIIETNLDSQSQLGLSWPTSVTTTLGAGSTSSTTANQSTELQNVAADYNLNTGTWTWGTLSVSQMSMILSMLEEKGNSKLISDPHVTTLENHEAVIEVATVIPIPTVTRFTEGAATQDIMTFYDEEVGISVVVTPRINEDGRITMDVRPTVEDIIGYTGSVEAQKPITISRSIRTRITVNDGETAALGGLLKEDVIKRERRVPLLGHIPLLGRLLFTSTSEETSTTDLIILITPRIMP